MNDGPSLTLKIEPDRIDGRAFLPLLRTENIRLGDDKAVIELWLEGADEYWLGFPAPGGVVDCAWLELAGDVLTHLASMDYQVQRDCAEECARTGYHPRNYESALMGITLTGPAEGVLHYAGAGVNTSWDEQFVRTERRWGRVAKRCI